MTRKLTKTLFIVGSMLLVAMGQGYAQKRSLREMLAKWWEHPRIQEKLKLDEAQVQQLNDIFYQYRIQLSIYVQSWKKPSLSLNRPWIRRTGTRMKFYSWPVRFRRPRIELN